MTIHRLVQRAAERAIASEREEVEACFGGGFIPESGGKVVPKLYVEADGLNNKASKGREEPS